MDINLKDKKYFSKKMLEWFQKNAIEIMTTEKMNLSAFGRKLGMPPGNVKRILNHSLNTVPLEALLRMCHHYSLVPDMFTPSTTKEVKQCYQSVSKEIAIAEKSLLQIKKSLNQLHQKQK